VIGLQPCDERDEIVPAFMRNWVYFDPSRKLPPGLQVVRTVALNTAIPAC
jgi:hypothetical protein